MEELQKQIEELTNKVNEMEKAQNLNQNVLLFNELDKIFPTKGYMKTSSVTSYGADLSRSITISSTPQSFSVPENPLKSAIITASDGIKYRILLYSLT